MINFRYLFEKIFSSFDISGDTKLINQLKKENNRFVLIVKRHWAYVFINSWKLLLIIIIVGLNVYTLMNSNIGNSTISIIISILLILNILYWFWVVLRYVILFFKIHGSVPKIEDIHSSTIKNNKSDIAFTNFFNQTITAMLLFLLIVLFSMYIIFIQINDAGGIKASGFGLVNIFLLFIQLFLFFSFLKNMMNLEMDFKVFVPDKVIFYNQNGLLGDTKSMNGKKIKTLNSNYPSIIASFFNYGDMIILAEGDRNSNGDMSMSYVGSPAGTIKEAENILANNINYLDDEINVTLKEIKNTLKIKDINKDKHLIAKYLIEQEENFKERYINGNKSIKKEIKELYKEFYNSKT